MPHARTAAARLLALTLFGSLLHACGGGSEPAQPPATYELRGVVKAVGGEGADARATIQHEAIPTFKDRQGRERPMKAMTMAFGIAPGVDRGALKQDAKVQMVIEVDWNREPALMIQKAAALPDDTELQL